MSGSFIWPEEITSEEKRSTLTSSAHKPPLVAAASYTLQEEDAAGEAEFVSPEAADGVEKYTVRIKIININDLK